MVSYVPVSWGESLRLARVQKNLSQVELSRIANVSAWTIHQIERKGVIPSERTRARLARSLHLTVSDLFPSHLPPGGDSAGAFSD